jgi:hypothetical protein
MVGDDWGSESVSVGVEPDLDTVRIAETHEHCSAGVALDESAVRLAEIVEPGAPPLHVVPIRHEQRDGVESGQCPGAAEVVSEGNLGPAPVGSQGDSPENPVLDELDHRLETEYPVVPGLAASEVADRQLDVVKPMSTAIPFLVVRL